MTEKSSVAVAASCPVSATAIVGQSPVAFASAGRGADFPDGAHRAAVDDFLRIAVGRLPAPLSRIAGFHLGWWDQNGSVIGNGGGGKGIRGELVLLAAEGVGGSTEAAVPAAAAVELMHNFSLIHDDVVDGDATRRHRQAVWAAFGTDLAILTGDALLALAFGELARCGHPATVEALGLLSEAVDGLLEGQARDLEFERRQDVGVEECRRMAVGKTGALLGRATALGALLGGGDHAQVAHLRRFGESLGLAFQFVDDILGIWGDPAVTGKPVHSDVASRKKSLPTVFALGSGTLAGDQLAALYAQSDPFTSAQLQRAAALIEEAGGRDWCQREAESLLAGALQDLWSAIPPHRAHGLEAMARLVVQRDH